MFERRQDRDSNIMLARLLDFKFGRRRWSGGSRLALLLGRVSTVPVSRWVEACVLGTGLLLAFLLGYFYAEGHPLDERWFQRYMGPAVNFACTGDFGPVELNTPDAESALSDFLFVKRMTYSCSLFDAKPTSFFDGLDSSNVEQPMYLKLLYGVLWRVVGLDWRISYWVDGGIVAASFLALYLCLRAFAPPLIIAPLTLAFLASPLYITHILAVRDACKFPFYLLIAAILVRVTALPRRPRDTIMLACAIGALIGIGYGFRSDLLQLVPIAVLVVGVLSPLVSAARFRRRAAVRIAAASTLIAAFALTGWMPLVNDYYLHSDFKYDVYHPLIMGLGIGDQSLFQSPIVTSVGYTIPTYRDISTAVRVGEYALRRDGVDPLTKAWIAIPTKAGSYFHYASRYYINLLRYFPGDFASRAIGAALNILATPASLVSNTPYLQDPIQRGDFQVESPWSKAYGVSPGSNTVLTRLDDWYETASHWQLPHVLFTNLIIFLTFVYIIALQFGVRSALTTVIIFGFTTVVSSLSFELRHIYHLYAFLLIAWVAVVSTGLKALAGRVGVSGSLRALGAVVTISIAATVIAASVLWIARAYQTRVLTTVFVDWASRPTVPAEFETWLADGMVHYKFHSPVPLSTGGERAPDAPMTKPGISMGAVAVTLDGQRCGGRFVKVGVDYNASAPAYLVPDEADGVLLNGQDSVAILPIFYYRNIENQWSQFNDINLATKNQICVKNIGFITEFKKDDLVMDYFLPKKLNDTKAVLFRQIGIRGVGTF